LVSVGVLVGICVAVKVGVIVGVFDGVRVGDGVKVAVEVGVAVKVGVGVGGTGVTVGTEVNVLGMLVRVEVGTWAISGISFGVRAIMIKEIPTTTMIMLIAIKNKIRNKPDRRTGLWLLLKMAAPANSDGQTGKRLIILVLPGDGDTQPCNVLPAAWMTYSFLRLSRESLFVKQGSEPISSR
jgi:hypothetical protein